VFNTRALITSRGAVYIFELQSGKWREIGKLSFGRAVQVHDLDWHWSTVVIGASDATGNAAYVFHMNADGTFSRISRLAPLDADAADRFGEHVAVYSTTVAVTAPGYNDEQGAAYIFVCSETQCAERQKLLANDGASSDGFGQALDLASGILVVGAPSADWVPGDPAKPPSEKNHHAGGAAYLFVRSGGTWVEQQKFRPSARELNWYSTFGYQVVILRDARHHRCALRRRQFRARIRGRVSLVRWLAGRDSCHARRREPRRSAGAVQRCAVGRRSEWARLLWRRLGVQPRSSVADTVRRGAPSL
jgi:hypothetical protein